MKQESNSFEQIHSLEERIKHVQQYTLFDDAFASYVLRQIEPCEHIIQVLMNNKKLHIKELRTQTDANDLTQEKLSNYVHELKNEKGDFLTMDAF